MSDFHRDAFEPDKRYLHLDPGGGVQTHLVDGFWPKLMGGELVLDGFLFGSSWLSADFPHWEMHPEGEEVLYMISGAADVHLEEDGQLRVVRIGPGQCVVVPRGAWHRAVVVEPGQMIFATAGKGTQHRPLAGGSA